jgi:hypothetical protein
MCVDLCACTLASSAITEWSITRSTGTNGFTPEGSLLFAHKEDVQGSNAIGKSVLSRCV